MTDSSLAPDLARVLLDLPQMPEAVIEQWLGEELKSGFVSAEDIEVVLREKFTNAGRALERLRAGSK